MPRLAERWASARPGYKWAHGDASPRRARRQMLVVLIGQIFAAHKSRYGSPRIAAELRDLGWSVSVNTVAKIMAEHGWVARRRRRRKGRPGRAGAGGRRRTWSGASSALTRSTRSGSGTAP